MITPMRFGLKYAPVPTLALEYEDDLAGVDDDGGGTSLYIYSSDRHASQQRMKKLHVVELPALTRQSEAVAVARQLQQDNRRFLAPDVVKEDQLVRLLERLMAHLQATELTVSSMTTTSAAAVTSVVTTAAAVSGVFGTHHHDPSDAQDAHDESELEASAMSESIAETSASLADSHVDDLKHGVDAGSQARTKAAAVRPSADSDGGDDDRDPDTEAVTAAAVRAPAAASDAHDDTYGDDVDEATERKREADADTVRRAALQRDDTASEAASDEDIQSEELEYFSEDESDEDSF